MPKVTHSSGLPFRSAKPGRLFKLRNGSRRQELLQGDLNGSATYYYARSRRSVAAATAGSNPNFAALRVTWAPLYQQRLQLLAAKIGLSADPPC